ncbi:MAG: cell division protein SepF [bacterium]
MSGWWNVFKDAFIRLYDDDYEPSLQKKTNDSDLGQMISTRESMRISPLEKPSQIAICIPETPDEEWLPADYLKTDRPVIVDFKKLDDEERDQIRNFLIGVIYATEGTFTKLRDDLFMFAPSEVGLITKHKNFDPKISEEFFSGDLNPEDL